MQYFALAVALASATLAVAQLTVNTPASLVECQPSSLSWSGGTAPYFPSIIPGGQPSAAALESFASTSATSLTWTVNLASGTSVTLQIRDSTGSINYSDQVTIQAGTSTSCVGQNSTAASGTSAAGAPSSTGSSSAGSSTTNSSTGGATTSAANGSSTPKAAGSTPAAGSTSPAAGASAHASSGASPSSSSGASSSAEMVSAGIFTVCAAALVALFA